MSSSMHSISGFTSPFKLKLNSSSQERHESSKFLGNDNFLKTDDFKSGLKNSSFSCKSSIQNLSSFQKFENSVKYCNGLKEIAEQGLYDVFLLDQFGVLHDGKHPYPEAISTMNHLSKLGVKSIIISNSSRRASYTIQKLNSLGFNDEHVFAVITSGELTHQNLLNRNDSFFSSLGNKCIHFNWKERGLINLDDLHLEFVESVEDADFFLVHGIECMTLSDGKTLSETKSLEDLKNVAMAAACEAKKRGSKSIPMIIANPDLVTVEKRQLRTMPGMLGLFYEKIGGEVIWMGKPGKAIYEEALRLGDALPSRCLAVGDSLYHDINGAKKHTLDSAFVAAGIHFDELALASFGHFPEKERLWALCKAYEANPTYVIPCFKWE